MASCCYPDILAWIQSLPPTSQWKQNSKSICICSSGLSQPSLNLSVVRNHVSPTISLSIFADFNLTVSLWTSKPVKTNSQPQKFLDNEAISSFMINFIQDVLSYSSDMCSPSVKLPRIGSVSNSKDIFNLSFLTLAFLVAIYEAPADLRAACLGGFKNQLTNCQLRAGTKSLMKIMGSNLEEQWMRSINLAITNWIVELQDSHGTLRTPSPLFSYSFSTYGLWKVQLYCPVIAMDIESSSGNPSADERLQFTLNYHQLEGVIQFNYKVIVQENWIDVIVSTDNIRCDIIRLLNETLMNERGVSKDEKHFPSRISLHLTPILQTNILSVSVSKSSHNPTREIGIEKGIETSFDPSSGLGLTLSAGETVSTSLKPWKFEESVYGYSGLLSWYLHDSVDGREIFSSKPSMMALINPKAWFKDRYSSAYRPFTRQGGVIFAGDEYGNSVTWKVDKTAIGKTMEWEIRGSIWLTYWPNRYKTLYTETRRLQFKEILHLTIA
ncbi:hypothetical protein Tsubulata_041088 [Turnera subulata]|uniref:Uncharacterized protein n=1 Tax=Turnera subulata TaxID=218843 RepID=A0A9Q0FK87_9ROSI|nr:hypothetical protein Tsubulata_041088 [Turnera subulata]